MRLEWSRLALADRDEKFDYIEADKHRAAIARSLSRPGQCILREAIRRIMDGNLAGQIRTPSPKHQIAIIGGGAGREAGNNHAGDVARDQAFGDFPG